MAASHYWLRYLVNFHSFQSTIAWLNRCRRLAKDWETLNRNALAFLKLASIRLMLRKLCNP
jgi:transposase